MKLKNDVRSHVVRKMQWWVYVLHKFGRLTFTGTRPSNDSVIITRTKPEILGKPISIS